ncbi:hypothetical protein H9N25_10385 [Pedobacter riviphilus]|uniref:Uncharacterized protein n=1 Tax=Pedobacter riviphilus TaxID=2766984 RepID=A0ABX6TMF4_9SPHI|nr:hypothetical protein [Pedobacter riviphilus]QNR86752.1 hypothetical protein H9N25_10385 [Pedobacter riviphilus]
MNQTVRTYLIDVARRKSNQIVGYQELSNDCGLKLDMSNPDHRNQIAQILEQISLHEYQCERPLLSSLVLRLSDGTEGNGFYKLAEKLGYGSWSKLKREGLFEVQQIANCIDFWSKNINHLKYR